MKKLSLLALVAAALVACGENNKPTPEDFKTVEAEIQAVNTAETPLTIISIGAAGDYVIAIPATDALKAVAAKEKTVTFLSVENPQQLVKEGQCLINIIPQKTMMEMNTPENKCNFRIFCGNADDMNAEAYAVEVCSE